MAKGCKANSTALGNDMLGPYPNQKMIEVLFQIKFSSTPRCWFYKNSTLYIVRD